MRYTNIILSSIILLLLSLHGNSQTLHTSSEKALKKYNEGIAAYDFLDYNKAESNFKEAISIDKHFYEAYIMLGELFSKESRFSEASMNYKRAVKIDSLFFKPVFFNLANAEMMSGDYSHALVHFNVYLSQEGMSANNKAVAAKNVRNCEFAIVAMKNPVLFNPVNLGPGINTNDDEYWPSITADGHTLIFTRQPNNSNNPNFRGVVQEDFYVSYFTDNIWQNSVNAGSPLNSVQNEGAQTLSSDGTYMYFTGCNRPGGKGACDIYFSAFSNGRWSVPSNVGAPINTSRWESQPSISADGKTLFFSSSRPGGKGGKDIWFSRLNDNKLWSEPVNMANINTEDDEMSPFIHFDGKTLYFASDGLVGMGGFDLFMTRLLNDSTWSAPKNLGYPINTYNDEMGLIIEAAGQKAYFSSIRDKSKGKDIFSFDLYESCQTRSGIIYER